MHKVYYSLSLSLSLSSAHTYTHAHTHVRTYVHTHTHTHNTCKHMNLYFAYTGFQWPENQRIFSLDGVNLFIPNTNATFSVQQTWHFYIGLLHRWISWFVTNQTATQTIFFFHAAAALVDLGLLIDVVSRAHSDVQYSIELLDEWSARRTDLYLTTHTFHKKHSCPSSGIRTRIPASEPPHMVLVNIIFPLPKHTFSENYPQFGHKP